MSFRKMSNLILKTPSYGESTSSPGKLFQCLITLTARRRCLISRLNLSNSIQILEMQGVWESKYKWHDTLYTNPKSKDYGNIENMTTKALFWQTFMQGGISLHRKWFSFNSASLHTCVKLCQGFKRNWKRGIWSGFCWKKY